LSSDQISPNESRISSQPLSCDMRQDALTRQSARCDHVKQRSCKKHARIT